MPVPYLGGVVIDVGLQQLDEIVGQMLVISQLERAAGAVVARDRAGIIAAADWRAAERDLLAREERSEAVLALRDDRQVERSVNRAHVMQRSAELGEFRVAVRRSGLGQHG